MDKQTALATLINDSTLQLEDKRKMLAEIENMDEQTIDELGHALAVQKQQEVEAAEHATNAIDQFLEEAKKEH